MHVTKCLCLIGLFAHELLMSLRNIYLERSVPVSVDIANNKKASDLQVVASLSIRSFHSYIYSVHDDRFIY